MLPETRARAVSPFHRAEIASTAIVQLVEPARDARTYLPSRSIAIGNPSTESSKSGMGVTFGEYANEGGASGLDNGMYDATIKSAALVMENGQPKATQDGKKQVDVFFQIDAETTVKRRYSISFGQNSATKTWAAFAKLIEAATGVKCGEKAQRQVTDMELVGRPVRIVIETNDRGYSDVANVMAAPQRQVAKQKPQPVVEPVTDEQLEDAIPF
jgi:hypothetical protein